MFAENKHPRNKSGQWIKKSTSLYSGAGSEGATQKKNNKLVKNLKIAQTVLRTAKELLP